MSTTSRLQVNSHTHIDWYFQKELILLGLNVKNGKILNNNLITTDIIRNGNLNLNSNFVIYPNGPSIVKSFNVDPTVIEGFTMKLLKSAPKHSMLTMNPITMFGRLDLTNVKFDNNVPRMSKPVQAWNIRAINDYDTTMNMDTGCDKQLSTLDHLRAGASNEDNVYIPFNKQITSDGTIVDTSVLDRKLLLLEKSVDENLAKREAREAAERNNINKP